jgi:hypothetical protein
LYKITALLYIRTAWFSILSSDTSNELSRSSNSSSEQFWAQNSVIWTLCFQGSVLWSGGDFI